MDNHMYSLDRQMIDKNTFIMQLVSDFVGTVLVVVLLLLFFLLQLLLLLFS